MCVGTNESEKNQKGIEEKWEKRIFLVKNVTRDIDDVLEQYRVCVPSVLVLVPNRIGDRCMFKIIYCEYSVRRAQPSNGKSTV